MNPREERLTDLLCDDALGALAPEDELELRALAGADPRAADERRDLEQAAAAVAVAASAGAGMAMPAHLVARIEEDALRTLGLRGAPPVVESPAAVVALRPRARRWPLVTGWVAAAACLALAVGSLVSKPREVVVTNTVFVPASAPAVASAPPPVAPPEADRRGLLATRGTERTEWSPTKEAVSKGALGDVVWNQQEQRGFMRFHGLAKNDPSVSQYQLWIFDGTRDARYPVDGGVFDVGDASGDGSGDVIVPIRARIPVGEPVLFAVTIEKPGGVVVSKREHIVLTAKTRA
jgi:hypothetical protein